MKNTTNDIITIQGSEKLIDDIEIDLITIKSKIKKLTDTYSCHFLLFGLSPRKGKIQTKSNYMDPEIIGGYIDNRFDDFDDVNLSIKTIIEKEMEFLEKCKDLKFKDITVINLKEDSIEYEDNMKESIAAKELTYNNREKYLDFYKEYNESIRIVDSYNYYKKVFNKIIEIVKQYKKKFVYIDLGHLSIVCIYLIQIVTGRGDVRHSTEIEKLRYISSKNIIKILTEFIKAIDNRLPEAKQNLIKIEQEYNNFVAKI